MWRKRNQEGGGRQRLPKEVRKKVFKDRGEAKSLQESLNRQTGSRKDEEEEDWERLKDGAMTKRV